MEFLLIKLTPSLDWLGLLAQIQMFMDWAEGYVE